MSLKTAMKLRLSVHCMVDRNMRESIVCAFAWNGCIRTIWRDSIRAKLNSIAFCTIEIVVTNKSNGLVAVYPVSISLNPS